MEVGGSTAAASCELHVWLSAAVLAAPVVSQLPRPLPTSAAPAPATSSIATPPAPAPGPSSSDPIAAPAPPTNIPAGTTTTSSSPSSSPLESSESFPFLSGASPSSSLPLASLSLSSSSFPFSSSSPSAASSSSSSSFIATSPSSSSSPSSSTSASSLLLSSSPSSRAGRSGSGGGQGVMSTFLADGRWTMGEAMRRFVRQNHLFHSDDELEAFLAAHRLLLRKRVPATTSRLLHTAGPSHDRGRRRRSVDDDGEDDDEDDDGDDDHGDDGETNDDDDDANRALEEGSAWVDYDRLVSAYAIHDNDVLEFVRRVERRRRRASGGGEQEKKRRDRRGPVMVEYRCEIPVHEIKSLLQRSSASVASPTIEEAIATICFPSPQESSARSERDVFLEKPPRCWASLLLDSREKERSIALDLAQPLSSLSFTDRTVLSVGFECASVVPSVLGVRMGFQRCRVLIHARRLYKTLVFSSDVHVGEVLHFLIEASLSRRRRRASNSADAHDGDYALYVTTLKKAMDVVIVDDQRRGGGRKKVSGAEEAMPWRRLASYRLKDKHILVLKRRPQLLQASAAEDSTSRRALSMSMGSRGGVDKKMSPALWSGGGSGSGSGVARAMGRSQSVYILPTSASLPAAASPLPGDSRLPSPPRAASSEFRQPLSTRSSQQQQQQQQQRQPGGAGGDVTKPKPKATSSKTTLVGKSPLLLAKTASDSEMSARAPRASGEQPQQPQPQPQQHFVVLFPQRKTYGHFHFPPNATITAIKQTIADTFLFASSSSSSSSSAPTPAAASDNSGNGEYMATEDLTGRATVVSGYSLFVPLQPRNHPCAQHGSLQGTSIASDDEEMMTSEEESEESESEGRQRSATSSAVTNSGGGGGAGGDDDDDYEEGLWLEEANGRTLESYNLSDAQFVIEFKRTPQKRRMLLVDGFTRTVTAFFRTRRGPSGSASAHASFDSFGGGRLTARGRSATSSRPMSTVQKVMLFRGSATVAEVLDQLKLAFGVGRRRPPLPATSARRSGEVEAEEQQEDDDEEEETVEEQEEEEEEEWGLYFWRGRTGKGMWLPDGQQQLDSLDIAWADRLELRKRASHADLSLALAEFSMPLEPTLLEGEKILQRADNVVHYLPPKGKTVGRLYLTNYQIIFLSYDKSSYEDLVTQSDSYIPFGVIAKAAKMPEQGDLQYLQIFCKDMRNILFGLKGKQTFLTALGIERTHPIITAITTLAHPKTILDTFAFLYKPTFARPSPKTGEAFNGWKVYSPLREYQRMGLIPSHHFRLVDKLNWDYGLCATYPAMFVIPAAVSDDELRAIASFRAKGRVPAVVWRHKTNGATISRCSQPMVGNLLVNNFNSASGNSSLMPTQSRRCTEDEKLAQMLRMLNDHNELLFVDARPIVNAVANSFKRGGSEDCMNVYKGCQQEFMGIGNVHAVRESWKKLQEMCQGTLTDHYYAALAGSRWLDNLSHVLTAATRIAEFVHKRNTSVIVHCTDGWDRTPQLTALAQLLLDPYYRTIVGFEVLIEKEWLSFGHQFTERCAHVGGTKNETPIFTMFIDCVWQVMQQFPLSFEFNERFLITILDEHYNCKFGTFLANAEREMREHNLAARTVSLWSYVNSKQHKRRFKNYLYTAKRKASAAAGKPRHHPRPPASHSPNDDHDHDHTDDGESEDESDDEREENESDDESEERRQGASEEDGAGGGGGGEDEGRVLFPRTSVRRLKLWDAYYMRWMADLGADREADERDAVIARLHDDNKRLRRRLKTRGLARQPQQNRSHGGDRTTAAK